MLLRNGPGIKFQNIIKGSNSSFCGGWVYVDSSTIVDLFFSSIANNNASISRLDKTEKTYPNTHMIHKESFDLRPPPSVYFNKNS